MTKRKAADIGLGFGLALSLVMILSALDALASTRSAVQVCRSGNADCRVSSWLGAVQRASVTEQVAADLESRQDQQNVPKATTPSGQNMASPRRLISTCNRSDQNCRRSSWLAPPSSLAGPSLVPKAQEPATELVTPSPSLQPVSRQSVNPEDNASTKKAAGSQVEPALKPLALTGPPPYNASTGTLNVKALAAQSSKDPAGPTKSEGGYKFIAAELKQNPEFYGDVGPARKSSWLQKLGWLESPSLTIGTRIWFSQGKLGYNFAAVGGPDVTSELLWQGQNTKIYEVRADLVARRFVSILTLGWGSIDQGTLRDLDFTGNSRTGIFSDTLSSPTDGYVVYGSVDLGPRLIRWEQKGKTGAVDFLLGFQYWREKWTARGVQDNIPGGRNTDANAITETVTWKSLRVGPRVIVPIIPRLRATGTAFYIPWTQYENNDIHLLRTDVSQNPSFREKASGGNGIQLEGALQANVWRELNLEAGYRYWDIRSGAGDSFFFFPCTIVGQGGMSNCQDRAGTLNDAKARRQGIFFGASWTF